MKIKNIIWLSLFVSFAVVSCTKDELPESVQSFSATKGTMIGIVQLAVEVSSGAQDYNYQRKNPATNNWEELHWGPSIMFDDNGWGLPNNKLLPGQTYEYRVRAHGDAGYSDWSEVVTGYIFSPSARVENISYEITDTISDTYELTYKIIDKLPELVGNYQERRFYLYRSETSYFDNHIVYRSVDLNNKDSVFVGSVTDYTYDPEKSYYYKLKVDYRYGMHGLNDANEMIWDENNLYTYESSIFEESDL